MSNVKQEVIDALFNKGEYIRQVNDVEYRTRCPFCGDSQKNFNTGHLYIRINVEDNFPMVYNCFKCNESGIVDSEFLSVMDIGSSELKASLINMNKNCDNQSSHKFLNGDNNIVFDYELPEVDRNEKIKYIEKRLDVKLSDKDIKKMKIITSLKDFLLLNKIDKIPCDTRVANNIEDHYVGFLTFGSSHILFRDISEREKYRWIKYPITKESNSCRAFYSIESSIDILSDEKIIINLCEGVLDGLSLYKNLGYNGENVLNIAVCGKHYVGILTKLLNMGLVGDNVELNIFADNDEDFNDKNNRPTDIAYFKRIMKKVRYLYGSVNVYYNTIGKDIGVGKEKIKLKRYRL